MAPAWQAGALHDRARGPKAIHLAPRRNHFTIMGHQPAIDAVANWFDRWVV